VDANGLSSNFTQMESLRESGRRQIAQTFLCALLVVEDFDVFGNLAAGLVTGRELAMIDEFIF
jgi:hypothetical protein